MIMNESTYSIFDEDCSIPVNDDLVILNNDLLNSPIARKQTDKPDYPDYSAITNDDFIAGIFGELTLVRPITVSFKGNPGTVNKSSWSGKPYIGFKTSLPSEANNYLSFATYTANDEGQYRRTKDQFAALHAIMLDDIGVKVPVDKIMLPPSWIIETSADNFQYGYILAAPIQNAGEATSLLDSIIEAGLCDPGASGACARIGRLPVAINGKTNFQCRLIEWKPEFRYTVEQMVEGLQFELKEKVIRKSSPRISTDLNTLDDVHIPRADTNPVIAALMARGLYKQPLGAAKHDITCPWVEEHTDQSDTGTAYWEPSESAPVGGFKCMHGHCVGRKINALNGFLGITKDVAKHLPIIRISAGEINRIVDIAEIELSKTSRYYQRAGIIVTVVTDPSTNATSIQPLSLSNLIRILAAIAIWQRFNVPNQEWISSDPSEKHVKILLDATQYRHLPIINGIARQPYFRADGNLVLLPGYDRASGMFGVFDARKFNVPEMPTREEAEAALIKLTELLSEFAFKSEQDKAAALSVIITATIRPSLRLAPMFHMLAPQIASGKSYLCELISLFATPEKSTPHSFPSNDEEMRKLLLSELLTAPAVIEFDNLTSDLLPHKSLCTALTSENISGRILGKSITAEVGTRVLFLSSGNNVEPVRDMTRRVITISLDPRCETPATRDFSKNPVGDVASNRGEFISAALIIVRAWDIAGKPITKIKSLSSYGEWSDLCRQPLLWLGLKDPASVVFESMAYDPSRLELDSFLEVCLTRYRFATISVKKIIDDLERFADLKEVIPNYAYQDGMIDNIRLGRWIKKHVGQLVNGLRLIADNSVKSNSARWRIERISTESDYSDLSVPIPVTEQFSPPEKTSKDLDELSNLLDDLQ